VPHKACYNPDSAMLRSYLPAIVFLGLGATIGLLFTMLNALVGVKGRATNTAKGDPYECGLPSDVKKSFRFGISFYLIAMLFILFDIEVIFLYPVAIQLRDFGTFALVEISVFIALLTAAFVYVWRRGALEWK
jgi:NADH-quinone oxidoreductase subunit A